MATAVPLVRVVRSGMTESVHLGSVAVADADGRLVAWAGDPGRVAFARSSMKPLQAAVSLSMAEEDLPDPEVAVMCASHNGEPVHVAAVGSILARASLGFGDLQTPPSLPLEAGAARAAPAPRAEYHNCSGKHAGMLLACVRRGFDPSSYRDPGHPFQQAVLRAVRATAGGEPSAIGVDGCGVPVHALPLAAMATLYARLVRPERLADLQAHARRAVASMRAAPYLVAGKGRVCTAAMEAAPGVIVKVGAEGLVCAGLEDQGLGVAVKADDGNPRAQEPSIVRVLGLMGTLDGAAEEALEPFARPPVLGGGDRVGELVADFELQHP